MTQFVDKPNLIYTTRARKQAPICSFKEELRKTLDSIFSFAII